MPFTNHQSAANKDTVSVCGDFFLCNQSLFQLERGIKQKMDDFRDTDSTDYTNFTQILSYALCVNLWNLCLSYHPIQLPGKKKADILHCRLPESRVSIAVILLAKDSEGFLFRFSLSLL